MSADEKVEHRIAVFVNEEIITSYDIVQRLKLNAIMQNINHPAYDLLKEAPPMRRRGRPHLNWTREIYKICSEVSDDADCVYHRISWRNAVNIYCLS